MTETPATKRRRWPLSRRIAASNRLVFAALLALCVTAVFGCGGSGSSSSATVTTKHVQGYGTVLATPSGQALYLLSADPPDSSKCTGQCAAEWPPLTKHGGLSGGSGAKSSLLSSLKRPDGSQQVAYNKHALYMHPGAPVASSAGTAAHGGIWYLVSPSGEAIKTTNVGGY